LESRGSGRALGSDYAPSGIGGNRSHRGGSKGMQNLSRAGASVVGGISQPGGQ